MILWLDAHISPQLAPWIHDTFGIDVIHVRDLDLREAEVRVLERQVLTDT